MPPAVCTHRREATPYLTLRACGSVPFWYRTIPVTLPEASFVKEVWASTALSRALPMHCKVLVEKSLHSWINGGNWMRPVVLFVLLLTGCATGAGGPNDNSGLGNCAWRVCVRPINTNSGRAYQAINREPVPATIVLTFRSPGNLRLRAGRPIETVVPARSDTILVHMSDVLRDPSNSAGLSIAIDLGASTTEADADYLYAVPFGGERPRELIQGFDGTDSHLASMRYSLDFAMPQGTPILAARGGTVFYLQDGFTRGGTNPDLLERANLVAVAHRDGTMASYGHLRSGIRVSVGDTVRVGDVLGSSGATGFVGQPHLHFHVGKRMLGEPGRTIPIKLRGRDGRPLNLEVGSLFAPGREAG